MAVPTLELILPNATPTSAPLASGPTSGSASPTGGPRRYRPELQGLRAVAVVLVVVYHVWLGRVSGGVDVFFLLSGFLLTGQLARAAASGGIDLGALWGRVIRRLVPAAAVVLAGVMAVGVVALPESRWFQTIREVVAAALFLENWQLVADAADYFGRHNHASVVQHFWSLAIQGQFYLVWPVLVAALAAVARRAGTGVRRPLAVLLAAVFAGSLAYSVVLTAADQPLAYFHSLTRAWEFALGGLLALGVERFAAPRPARIALGWAGAIGLVACGLVLQVGSVFPGWLALWPTLCGAAVIAAGATSSRFGVDRVLVSPALRHLGDLGYSLYLWHWPVLVFYLVIRGREEVGLAGGVFVIAVSAALSVATHHLVEVPARRSGGGRWSGYRLGVLALVPVLVAAGCWQVVSLRKAASYAVLVDDPDHPGALARTPEFEYWGSEEATIIPPMVTLPRDFAGIAGSRCTRSPRNKGLEICTAPGTSTPAKRIVVVGDSHMQQYLGVIWSIAEGRNWGVTFMLRGACPFSVDADAMPGDRGCVQWNADAAEEIRALRPDLVVTNGSRDVRVGLTERTPPGFVEQWRALDRAGIPVLAVRDNPRFGFSPSACLVANGMDAEPCSTPRAELLTVEPPYAELPDLPPNVSFADFSDLFCDDTLCPPVIGNVHVYLDDNHVSATYAATMTPMVERELVARLGE
ncbi:acyltransferase family protein [Saccharothrix australiensis]|uniref:acyltransferase family protein n=1 Tax=Saccharothrix australiensis TaxID=2072 RepID=UPI002482651F|nr:acyltransferase family protein [Saccharothrix australiensis]